MVVVAPRSGGAGRAARMIEATYRSDVDRGRVTAAQARARLRNVQLTPHYSDLKGVEFVIESVLEDLATKHDVLAAVERVVSSDTVFASNTSSIPIARIAATAQTPHRVIGTHYFWPAHRFRLVEIARAATTGEPTLHRTLDFIRWQGKVPLLVRDLPGFFTTRVILAYLNEAIALVTEGASVDAVDKAMEAFGWAMGPFRLLDAVGIEKFRGIYHSVHRHLGDRVGHIDRLWPLMEAGYLGHRGDRREGAKGFYLYPDGTEVDARVYSLIGRSLSAPPAPSEISIRPVWQMINEIGHCLAEGVVASTEDANLGAVLGLGWPPIHRTPLAYARAIGVRNVVGQLNAWTHQYGGRFTPSVGMLEGAAVSPYSDALEATAISSAKRAARVD